MFLAIDFITVFASPDKIKAPNNSNLGMDCFFIGATRALEATDLVVIDASW